MKINSNFDGGNINCLDISDPKNIQLAIKVDENSDKLQWFYFRLSGAKDTACQLNILNASECSYTEGWENYQAVASYDRETWFRVETHFDGKKLSIVHTPDCDAVYYAYFAPYTMERHADLVAEAQLSPLVSLKVLGSTIDGQDIDLLCIGDGSANKKNLWTIARQHPGETMAQWWMEGFISRLLDSDDAVSKAMLERFNFYIVPNMNPDGSRRGHLRTNAAGVNLNRTWSNPSPETSPEVYYVQQEMKRVGVDFHFDVHGDEALPYNFIAGAEGIPSWNPDKQAQLDQFKDEMVKANPDFQTKYGYEVDEPGKADLRICTNFMSEEFQCLAMTLEMPFKDTADTPDELFGWSPERCIRLGQSSLSAMYAMRDHLQA